MLIGSEGREKRSGEIITRINTTRMLDIVLPEVESDLEVRLEPPGLYTRNAGLGV